MSDHTITKTALACANIALVKYWGKRDLSLNLPAVGSISLTLDALQTKSSVTFDRKFKHDVLKINDQLAGDPQQIRVNKFMDLIRHRANSTLFARIDSYNNFPTGAGLASSASAFAALSLAASAALGLNLSKSELSILARLGSGSAARSVFGGFVEMYRGKKPDGSDAHAIQIKPKKFWDLRLLVLVTSKDEKHIGSTEAMRICADTSSYYGKWIEKADHDLAEMRRAINNKDVEKLGDMAEYSALKMHALMLSARPAIIYWNAKTIELIHLVQGLRKKGIPAWFTIDAGPQVKVVSLPECIPPLKREFQLISGIEKIIESRLGDDAVLFEEDH